jgi:hypothetical protein
MRREMILTMLLQENIRWSGAAGDGHCCFYLRAGLALKGLPYLEKEVDELKCFLACTIMTDISL